MQPHCGLSLLHHPCALSHFPWPCTKPSRGKIPRVIYVHNTFALSCRMGGIACMTRPLFITHHNTPDEELKSHTKTLREEPTGGAWATTARKKKICPKNEPSREKMQKLWWKSESLGFRCWERGWNMWASCEDPWNLKGHQLGLEHCGLVLALCPWFYA